MSSEQKIVIKRVAEINIFSLLSKNTEQELCDEIQSFTKQLIERNHGFYCSELMLMQIVCFENRLLLNAGTNSDIRKYMKILQEKHSSLPCDIDINTSTLGTLEYAEKVSLREIICVRNLLFNKFFYFVPVKGGP